MSGGYVDTLFWKDKKVFLTGHTGFKGGWLALWLQSMGAAVHGYALAPNTSPNFYDVLGIGSLIKKSTIADIRDLGSLSKAISLAEPDVVIHMAAQPLVRYSYANPVETYEVNVMGTVHILEVIRSLDSVRATIIVTSDKCYENKEWPWGYRECDSMGGYDPYSSSKGCAELITSAYRQSYFCESSSANKLASARAGNVIGGGDWSDDRLIPDAIRAFEAQVPLIVRNSLATRPWQHVLDALSGYLILAQKLYEGGGLFASGWNFGPPVEGGRSVQEVVDLIRSEWGIAVEINCATSNQHHEAQALRLDSSRAYSELGWSPKWSLETSISKIIQWQTAYASCFDMRDFSLQQIREHQDS